MNEWGTGLEPIRQAEDTSDRLLSGEAVTGGRYGAPISCGVNDRGVSRQALSASIHGRRLSINALGSNPTQVLVFKDGVLDASETSGIVKLKSGRPKAGVEDGCEVTVGGGDVTVVIAMGTQIQEQDERSIVRTHGVEGASRMAFGEDEAQSVIQHVGDVRDLRVKRVIEESLRHSNFIRLDFKVNTGVSVPVVEAPQAARVAETHDVSMMYEVHIKPEETPVSNVDPRIVGRLTNGGNILMGCAEHAGLGVDIQMGAGDEVATRQVLVRLSQDGEKNFAVVERLSPTYPTEVYSVDEKGVMTALPGAGGIDRIELPSDRKVSVRIGLGKAPHLMLPEDGLGAPSESRMAASKGVPEEELAGSPIEMSRYRLALSFTPKEKAG